MGKLNVVTEIVRYIKIREEVKILVPLSKQILVQENDFVKLVIHYQMELLLLLTFLAIKGPTGLKRYIVNEVQDVYRIQGVKINDKHFEVIDASNDA